MQFSIHLSDGSLPRYEYEGEFCTENFDDVIAHLDREGQFNRVSAFYYRRRNDETGLIVIGGTAQAHAQHIADVKARTGHYWDNWGYAVIPSSFKFFAYLSFYRVISAVLSQIAVVQSERLNLRMSHVSSFDVRVSDVGFKRYAFLMLMSWLQSSPYGYALLYGAHAGAIYNRRMAYHAALTKIRGY